jgi:lysophospholipase L1-like esterase
MVWRSPFRSILGIAAVLAVASCQGDSPSAPTPTPQPPALALTCPSPVSVASEVTPVAVTYTAPVASGGTFPVQVACTIASGGAFPQGTTDVVCTATDAQLSRAQCTFSVEVRLLRQLVGTTFLAFGDSITEGEVSQPAVTLHVLDPTRSYPTVLLELLQERYVLQAFDIVVANRGLSGEGVVEGEQRLVDAIDELQPDVLLLLEGANDANGDTLGVTAIVQSLLNDIRRAFERGVQAVFISTLLPQVPGRPRAFNPEKIIAVNQVLRPSVAGTGAILVDSYEAFAPQKELLIGEDGLHPTAEGYRFLAGLFLDAIRENFEQPASTSGGGTVRPAPAFGPLRPVH